MTCIFHGNSIEFDRNVIGIPWDLPSFSTKLPSKWHEKNPCHIFSRVNINFDIWITRLLFTLPYREFVIGEGRMLRDKDDNPIIFRPFKRFEESTSFEARESRLERHLDYVPECAGAGNSNYFIYVARHMFFMCMVSSCKIREIRLNSRVAHTCTRDSHPIPNPARVSNHLPGFPPNFVLHERVDRRHLLIWISNVELKIWRMDSWRIQVDETLY